MAPRQFSIEEQLLRRNVKRFRGGLAVKAHRLVYHSTLDWRVIKKKEVRPRVKVVRSKSGPASNVVRSQKWPHVKSCEKALAERAIALSRTAAFAA